MSIGRVITGIASLAILAAGGVAFWLLSQNAPGAAQETERTRQAPLIETVTVTAPEEPPMIRQTGFLVPYREVDVSFEVRGRIDTVTEEFAVGNAVSEGTVLARIDTERLESAVTQAEADLSAAEARAREAEQAFSRQEQLEDRGVTAEASLEEVRAARETAEAQVAVAEARVEAARIDLRSAEIDAPFEAYVTDRTASEGQLVTVGQSVGRLVRADIARLVVGLSDRQVQALEDVSRLIGTEVAIFRAAGDGSPVRTGNIVDVDVRLDQATRTTNLLIDVPDPFGTDPIRLGDLLSVEIPFETPNPLVAVPVTAIKEGRRVWTITDNQTLEQREVMVVLRSDDRAWLSDAEALQGTRLMTTDLAGATDGTQVRVASAGNASSDEPGNGSQSGSGTGSRSQSDTAGGTEDGG